MKLLSRVRLLATAWTAAYQAPPSMGFSRQEYWSGVPSPSLQSSLAILKMIRMQSLLTTSTITWGLPRWLSSEEFACWCRRCRRCGLDPWVRKIPWSKKWQSTPVFLPGKFHGQRGAWRAYSPWGCQESGMTEGLSMYVRMSYYYLAPATIISCLDCCDNL